MKITLEHCKRQIIVEDKNALIIDDVMDLFCDILCAAGFHYSLTEKFRSDYEESMESEEDDQSTHHSCSGLEAKCSWDVWVLENEDIDIWETGCGKNHYFKFGGPELNDFDFCPYCGKAIKNGE